MTDKYTDLENALGMNPVPDMRYITGSLSTIFELLKDWEAAEIEITALHQERKETEESIIKLLADLKAAREEVERESGWVVENGDQGDAIRYRSMDMGLAIWVQDINEAIRFSRREDAEIFAAEDDEAWCIREHVWLPQPPTDKDADNEWMR